MEAPLNSALTVLYTANIGGDAAALTSLLPRLYTLIRRRRGLAAPGRSLLLDLGDSCAPDVWPCSVTGGRSTLIVLDAMGYDAANASALSPENRAKLEGSLMQMGLVDSAHDWQRDNIVVTCRNAPVDAIRLCISLNPADSAHMEGRCLCLAPVERGQLGVVRVSTDMPALLEYEVLDLPPGTPPDPTIAGAADFVLGEARYFQRKQDRNR